MSAHSVAVGKVRQGRQSFDGPAGVLARKLFDAKLGARYIAGTWANHRHFKSSVRGIYARSILFGLIARAEPARRGAVEGVSVGWG